MNFAREVLLVAFEGAAAARLEGTRSALHQTQTAVQAYFTNHFKMARFPVLLAVGLAILSAASAAKCPSFMHSVSDSESKYAYPIGVDVFENYPQKICAALPQWSELCRRLVISVRNC